MNKALLSVLFSLIICSASSQRIYFIYLQTETQQPFFVKLDEKIHSSSASGYLILSRLKDSSYNLTVGFTGNMAGEQKFICTINRKDHGYLLRNFGEKGWGLLDLQTASVQMATNEKKDVSANPVQVNAFTDLLSKAADDSTLKQLNVLREEKKPELVATTGKKEELPPGKTSEANAKTGTGLIAASAVIKQKEDNKETGVNKPGQKVMARDTISLSSPASKGTKKTEDSVAVAVVEKKVADTVVSGKNDKPGEIIKPNEVNKPNEKFVRTKVVRKSESSTTEGFGLIYIDEYADGSQDTIRLLIADDTKVQFAETLTKDTTRSKENTAAISKESAQNAVVPVTEKNSIKNACRSIASDADFYKLRKKMAGGKSDGDMLEEAKRSFKAKCFTTGQVKNLGALFLGDGGKYNFFDAAYPHISDTVNFASLQTELKDEYFINRFKAMLR